MNMGVSSCIRTKKEQIPIFVNSNVAGSKQNSVGKSSARRTLVWSKEPNILKTVPLVQIELATSSKSHMFLRGEIKYEVCSIC